MNSCPRMSPGSMLGIAPCSKCRSDPQIAVRFTLMIASRGCLIFSSPTARRRLEMDRSRRVHLRPGKRAPADPLIRLLAVDLRVPLHHLAVRPVGNPVRYPVVDARDRAQVLHESREILQIPPELV